MAPNRDSTPPDDGETRERRVWLGFARKAIQQRPHPPCANCLRPAAIGVDIGPDVGSQRDPTREQLWLCPECTEALIDNLPMFHEMYATERTMRRDA